MQSTGTILSVLAAPVVLGNGYNEALTPEERRHAMGNSGDVYERHYMPSFIDADCQAIYLGTTRREDLIRAVGRLERHDDAPDKLTNAQKEEISKDQYILKKIQDRKGYVLKIKEEGYATIKAAKDTFWYKKHHKAQQKINCRKTQLKNELLNRAINDFHETVHVDEVDRQMRGILPDNEVLTPSTIEYELEERATVAKLLFQPLDELHEDQAFDIRVQLVLALAQLCHRQETPRQLKAVQSKRHSKTRHSYAGTSVEVQDDVLQEEGGDTVTRVRRMQTLDNRLHTEAKPYCPFCEKGPFQRRDSLGRHVRVQHLQRQSANGGFLCPYKECSAVMGNSGHFLSHARREHEVYL
ncbi:uncharacterized protein RSE6_14042 [Rhynchosporium secalis]|uniref:C2H2-type domain-containing protein n=1 Tax=Rhynchosporium secalis TaxID=38038 RepID=A0A1E1MUC6_RHYSE|nr:uncharacterized protein RSE6_14042 [Rhynchosporium secalis]